MDTLAEESHPKKVGRQAAVVQSFLLSGHDREPSVRRMTAYLPHRFRLRLETEADLGSCPAIKILRNREFSFPSMLS